MRIGYIVHDLNDPSVERRCRMFEDGGASVTLTGFARGNGMSPAIAARRPLVIGQSEDAAFVTRARETLRHMFSPKAVRDHLSDCDVIIARNLEQLGIATRVAGSRPLVYECLDIHRLLVGTSLPAKAVQTVEARLLPHSDMLITSSPAFLREHFDDRLDNQTALLVENKLSVDTVPDELPTGPAPSLPTRIGWFGMLRCRRTFSVLAKLTEASHGRIEVLISGKPSVAELPTLASDVENMQGVEYTGPYTYSDLPDLYDRCHFAWAVDWFEEGLNSKWLLPNRLYEALSQGAVPIVLEGTELARWAEQRGVGLRVRDADSAIETLLGLNEDDIRRLQHQVARIRPRDVMADKKDCIDLVNAISELAPQ